MLDELNLGDVLLGGGIPYTAGVFHDGLHEGVVAASLHITGAAA